MNVLSLFNGMSCGMMALEEIGIKVSKYYSSEIDKYANQATQAIFPNAIQLGDVTNWRNWNLDWSGIDLVTGGFPCQAWSMAGKQLGDKDERGMLFWTMLDIMKHVMFLNPKAKFLIENVKMKKEFEEYITKHTENALGRVDKILINSALVSAQNRNRYYWTNIQGIGQPEDEGVLLKHIINKSTNIDITEQVLSKPCGRATYINCWKNMRKKSQKAKCLTASGQNISNASSTNVDNEDGTYSKLTPRECMRLQTVPEHHIDTLLNAGISNTQLYKMTGNSWTVDVIAHIFKGLL